MSEENLIQVTEEPTLEELFGEFYALYDESEERHADPKPHSGLVEDWSECLSLEELFGEFYARYDESESRGT